MNLSQKYMIFQHSLSLQGRNAKNINIFVKNKKCNWKVNLNTFGSTIIFVGKIITVKESVTKLSVATKYQDNK